VKFGGWAILLAVAAGCATHVPARSLSYRVEGDAIPVRLATGGDAARGRDIVMGRDANCLLCHAIPETGARFMGNIGPPLSGVGARLTEGQLRLRIVDQSRLNRDTVMPSYSRVEGLNRVATAYRGKSILGAGQIEDVITFLKTLQ
jgi:sulfur-oxidizing protein SoxX